MNRQREYFADARLDTRPDSVQGQQLAPWTVSAQLAEAGSRYVGRLGSDRRMQAGLTDALLKNMGCCAAHDQLLSELHSPVQELVQACKSAADAQLEDLLTRARLHDELVQDILFGASTRCPVCAFVHRLQGRIFSRLLCDLQNRRIRAQDLYGSELSFCHAELLTEKADPFLRPVLAKALKRQAVDLIALADVADGSRHMARNLRNTVVNAVLPVGDHQHAIWCNRVERGCMCPVCLAAGRAQRDWLLVVRDNVRLEQPLWMALPACAHHVISCLIELEDVPAGTLIRQYVHDALVSPRALLAGSMSCPVPRRRRSIQWFDQSKAPVSANAKRVSHPLPGAASAAGRRPCPGCRAQEIAVCREVASIVKMLVKNNGCITEPSLASLCAKHIAEIVVLLTGDAAVRFFQSMFRGRGVLYKHDEMRGNMSTNRARTNAGKRLA
ncbi:hypothetical protein [Paraburkholderia sp. C35]|uniref:hypothetical protein n=1 Tax=Paraburkholderia sp. C35 TaxID=2126993 RepID=UPI000D697F75|nr:hypothetical protein [Paraburkholderia sp. C35]